MNDPIVWLILDPCSKGGYWVLPKVKHNIPAPILDREKRLNTWIKELLSLLSSRLQIINNFFLRFQETHLTETAQDHPGFERAVQLAIDEHEDMNLRFCLSPKPSSSSSSRPDSQSLTSPIHCVSWESLKLCIKSLLYLESPII